MSLETRTGTKALGAKFAGLGIATAVAVAVVGSPAIARADEVPDAAAGNDPVVVETPAEPEEKAPAKETKGTEIVAHMPTVVEAPAETKAPASEQTQKTAKNETTSEQTAGTNKGTDAQPEGSTSEEDAQKADATAPAEQPEATTANEEAKAPAANEETAPAETSQQTVTLVSPATPATPAATTSEPAQQQETVTLAAKDGEGSADSSLGNVYRVYNPNSGEHFYTGSLYEATHLFNVGWRWESTAYEASSSANGGQAVYRLYNPNAGAHFYTTAVEESNHLRSLGWKYEGIAWYAVGGAKLYRVYNPNSPIGEHLYTTNADERDNAIRHGWHDEGTAWSVTPGFRLITGQWVVSSAYGSLERYWIQSDTDLARNRYIETSEGSGWRAYATGSGAVVRNKTHVGNGVMFADNAGSLVALPTQNGWWVTSAVDGSAQRYYITTIGSAANGASIIGALTGWFNVGGQQYYGFYNDGYVARNTVIGKNGNEVYSANNDGVLTLANDYRTTGWKYANNVGSGTGWFLANSLNNYRVMVFHKRSGNDPWVMEHDFLSGYGNNTFMGRYKILGRFMRKDNGYQYTLYNTYYAYAPNEGYSTRWQMYHGSLYYTANGALAETGLGQKVSGGCIRLSDENAKYVYDNVPDGSVMYTYR